MAEAGNSVGAGSVSPPRAAVPRRLTGTRLRRLTGTVRRDWAARFNRLGTLLAEELHVRPGRGYYALRSALIIALGAGLMSALAIDGPIGPYILQGVVGGPVAMSPGSACVLSGALALAAGSSLSIIGVLVEAPWLFLAFFFVVGTALTYAMLAGPLSGGKWLYVEVAFLNTFFLVVFDPGNVGWSVAYTFAGGAVAFAVVMVFDTWLWPMPAEATLIQALVDYLDLIRDRLIAAGRNFLDPSITAPHSTALSQAPTLLSLLSRAADEGLDLRRHAMLTAAVTLAERLKIEVERLLVITHEAGAPDRRRLLAPELGEMLDALQDSLLRHTRHLTGPMTGKEDPALNAAIEREDRALVALLAGVDRLLEPGEGSQTAELSNLSSFVIGLRRLARLLEKPVDELPLPRTGSPSRSPHRTGWDPEMLTHAVKVSLSMTVGLLVVLISNHGELDTVSLTIMITALPSYGATLRKANLRLTGAVVGAAFALGAMILVTPNSSSVGTYMGTLFVVSLIAAYVGLSGPRLAYLGKQILVTFILTYVGLAPAADVYRPLYRILGVLLGIVIVAAVFLLIAPTYSSRSLIVRIRKLLRATLDLLPSNVTAGTLTVERIESTHVEVVKLVGELLAVADDARLEGARSGIDPDQVVHGCGTLRRLSLRASDLSRWYLAELTIPPRSAQFLADFEAALRLRLQYWLDYNARLTAAQGRGRLKFPHPAPPGAQELERRYAALREYFSGPGLDEIRAWPALDKTALLAQIESCGRLVVLARELDEQLSLIPRAWQAA